MCPADGALARTLCSGVSNGTERSVLIGGPYRLLWPCRMGYQHVSEIMATGSQMRSLRAGDRVFSATFPGHVEFHVLRDHDLHVKLHADDPAEAMALLGVAGVAVHNVRRAGVRSTDRVLVIGAGLIGQCCAQAAAATGASVVVTDRHADRLQLAQALSKAASVDANREDGWTRVADRGPYDVVLECSGALELSRLIAPGGASLFGRRSRPRLVLVAGRETVQYPFVPAGGVELTVLHTQHFDQADLDAALEMHRAGTLKLAPLVRDVVPVSDAPEIYSRLRDEPASLLGTIFTFDQSWRTP